MLSREFLQGRSFFIIFEKRIKPLSPEMPMLITISEIRKTDFIQTFRDEVNFR
ncbi:hypothetical protein Pan153_45090 [Gimesia panareensis]|uniref:Uncharacterized protein n=1 Tax=Gimesia panareensis TaxID=2527978 RepID=A0A517QBN4_9PLAN|nr:hypothetical protein Enr10x_43920 [Gimesia panareensis]QDU51895.1 hypothetical protein Pan110_42650 [Gimesia panareensis]QDV19840.1 hypothetical protein Pan153_45090 [Gimesia panareensis]